MKGTFLFYEWVPQKRYESRFSIKCRNSPRSGSGSFKKKPVRISLLLTFGKHLHGNVISLRGVDWPHKTSLTLPLFIEDPVPCREREQSIISRGNNFALFSTILRLDFGTVLSVVYLFFI